MNKVTVSFEGEQGHGKTVFSRLFLKHFAQNMQDNLPNGYPATEIEVKDGRHKVAEITVIDGDVTIERFEAPV